MTMISFCNTKVLKMAQKLKIKIADIFTMEKALFNFINFLFLKRFSKFLWHFLRHFECKMVTWTFFFFEIFKKSEILKMVYGQ